MVTGKPTVYRQDLMVALTKCQLVAKELEKLHDGQ